MPISDHLENYKRYVEAVAPEYDGKYGAPLSEHEKRILVDAGRSTRGWIVDIGCGTGRHSRLLATLDRPLIYMDFSRSMIKRAKQKLSDSHKSWPVLADARHLPIGPESIGLVVCLGCTIGGIPSSEARQKVVLESGRVLSRGGLLLVDYRNRLSPDPPSSLKWLILNLFYWLRMPKRLMIRDDSRYKATHVGPEIGDLVVLDKDMGLEFYNHISTVREIETMLRNAGFVAKTFSSGRGFSRRFAWKPITLGRKTP